MPNETDIDTDAHPDLTEAASRLRAFMRELQGYLSGVSAQLEREHKAEAATVKVYAARIADFLEIPYPEFIPSDAAYKGEVRMSTIDAIPSHQPNLRTLEGAMRFLDYHAPSEAQRGAHQNVNANFQALLKNVWSNIPEGPGRTVFLRDLNRARMSANSAIQNHGA